MGRSVSATESAVARFLYEQGRRDVGGGTPWADLTAGERDELCEMARPLVPVLERIRDQVLAEMSNHAG